MINRRERRKNMYYQLYIVKKAEKNIIYIQLRTNSPLIHKIYKLNFWN